MKDLFLITITMLNQIWNFKNLCIFFNVKLSFTERPSVNLLPSAFIHIKDLRFSGLFSHEEQEARLSLIIHPS